MEKSDVTPTVAPAVAVPTDWQGRALGILRFWIADWPRWWNSLTLYQKAAPAGWIALYWAALLALRGFSPDHLMVGLLVLGLGYAGHPGRVLLRFLLPLVLTGVIYDSQRYYSDYIRGPVHVQEPYLFDKYFFGIPTADGVLTPNEWWQKHTHPVLDLITGFFYITFIGLFVLTCAYFEFWVSRRGTTKLPAAEISRRAPRAMWGFFWLNVIGYSTYYWYAAAPPWYVTLYGLGPANMSALPNPAGCIRFDLMLGTHFFTSFYGRSADVFGAIPSLHIAYPLLAVYFAHRFGAARLWTWVFFFWMCFSAVYLNHHYILDIIWGSAYALAIAWLMDPGLDYWRKWRNSRQQI